MQNWIERTLTSENPQMVFNKKTTFATDGFEIETVKTAFKSAAITWRIKYREHAEPDIINLLQSSVFAVNCKHDKVSNIEECFEI